MQRDIRRLAMQLLYQIDLRGEADREAIAQAIDADHDSQTVRDAAWPLAESAWAARATADTLATELAPDWPTHRQPPIDRAILRLAWYEMTNERAPINVVINEAVELAKHYSTDQSAAFVNGLLDKMAGRVGDADDAKAGDQESRKAGDDGRENDTWLAGALRDDESRPPPGTTE